MDINVLLSRLQSTKLYYDRALHDCKSQSQSILKIVRKRYGWSQVQLAKLLDCTASYVSQIENDHNPASTPVLLGLAEIVQEMEAIEDDIAQG